MATRVVVPRPPAVVCIRLCMCVLFTVQPLNFPFIAVLPSLRAFLVVILALFSTS